jgi:hypothetical protein
MFLLLYLYSEYFRINVAIKYSNKIYLFNIEQEFKKKLCFMAFSKICLSDGIILVILHIDKKSLIIFLQNKINKK